MIIIVIFIIHRSEKALGGLLLVEGLLDLLFNSKISLVSALIVLIKISIYDESFSLALLEEA